MNADFFKYHALGNDYVVIDPNKAGIKLTAGNIKRICHRNFGIGSDGILYGPVFDSGKIKLRIYNPDGSEAEKSGNGIRIFARFLVDAGYVKEKVFDLHTPGGLVQVEILGDTAERIRVNMGKVTFESSRIPVKGSLREVVDETLCLGEREVKVTCLSIGNPHCVIPMDGISKELACKLGPLAENHWMFPNRINMQLLRVLDRNNIQIEIWERGAGYTLASGSSSCAAAGAAYRLGRVEDTVRVHMPGGTIDIEIKKDGSVYMTGRVASVASGRFSAEFRTMLQDRAEHE